MKLSAIPCTRRLGLLALLSGPACLAQFSQGNFAANLAALGCDTALVWRSDKVRDPIGWTPDNQSIVVKIGGEYRRIELDSLLLKRFKWRTDLDIAGPVVRPLLHPVTAAERAKVLFADEGAAREVMLRRGVKVELAELPEGGVALRIQLKGGEPKELWRTNLEDCQGLAPSPDQRWVAFICGLHGVVVMKLP